MDLSDLFEWDDDEVQEALEEIDHGLTARQIEWVVSLREALGENGTWTSGQRKTACAILEEWNDG